MDINYLRLNFSWVIESKLAGHRGVQSPEHLDFLWERGIRVLVRMTQVPKITKHEIKKVGFRDYHLRIPDMTAPTMEQMSEMVTFIRDCLDRGQPVGVSCDGGFGRTATLLSCYLISTGLSITVAISEVKARRPGSVLTVEQEKAVSNFEKFLKT